MKLTSLIGLLLILTACTQTIQRPSADISFKQGALFYKNEKFSGVVFEQFEMAQTKRFSNYKDGFLHGEEKELNFDNQILAIRKYEKGRKHGRHLGWFENDSKKFQYDYKNGTQVGEAFEWFRDGKISMYVKFKDDGTTLAKKMWRSTGQIYMNWVFHENKAYGVPGTQLCLQVRK